MKNSVNLIGYLGKNPEVNHLDNGNVVAKFSLATSETWRDKNGDKKEETQWHNIILWGNTAEIAEKYLQKGDLIAIDGKIVNRSWESKDGNKQYITEIVTKNLTMLGGSKRKKQTPENAPIGKGVEPNDLPY